MNMQMSQPTANSSTLDRQPTAGGGVGKRMATLQAHCALDGVELHRIEDDCGRTIYVVTKGPMTRELRDLEAVAQWLGRRSGVTAVDSDSFAHTNVALYSLVSEPWATEVSATSVRGSLDRPGQPVSGAMNVRRGASSNGGA